MLKIEDLKVGGEVECVSSFHVEIKEKDRLEVTDVNERSIAFMSIKNGNKYTFNKSYMDCFKKIEKYTFDDLIDVARKAFDDGVLQGYEVEHKLTKSLSVKFSDTKVLTWCLGDDDYSIPIGHIKSLYKETFVIECEEDIARIKIDADVTLANGLSAKCVSCQTRDFDRTVRLDCKSADDIFGIFVLKGAKVEQSKG